MPIPRVALPRPRVPPAAFPRRGFEAPALGFGAAAGGQLRAAGGAAELQIPHLHGAGGKIGHGRRTCCFFVQRKIIYIYIYMVFVCRGCWDLRCLTIVAVHGMWRSTLVFVSGVRTEVGWVIHFRAVAGLDELDTL